MRCVRTLAAVMAATAGVLASTDTAIADQERHPRVLERDSGNLRAGVIRRDANGQLVLDTSAEARRAARNSQSENTARTPGPCVRDGAVEAIVQAPEWIRELVDTMAPTYKLDPELVVAVMAVESNFEHKAVSPKNAQGLMQLIPDTARRFGVSKPFDPAENLRGGMQYLRWLLDHFNGDLTLALAGYNAGEKAVAKHRGVPPYRETRHYVRAVQRLYGCSPKRAPIQVADIPHSRTAADFGVEQSAWPPVRAAGELWSATEPTHR